MANHQAPTPKGKLKQNVDGEKKDFKAPEVIFRGEIVEPTDPSEVPLLYFKRFVTQEIIELIMEYTNRYSVQKQGKCVNTSVKEIWYVHENGPCRDACSTDVLGKRISVPCSYYRSHEQKQISFTSFCD